MLARTVRQIPRAIALSLAVAACAAPGPAVPSASSPGSPSSAAPTVVKTPPVTLMPPAPTPLNPAPAKMLGKWSTEFAEDDIATLTITATRIKIVRFGSADLRLEVFGDELVLSHSQLCAGEGRYAWSIDGDTLRFDSVTPDPCDGRAKSFDGVTYTRDRT